MKVPPEFLDRLKWAIYEWIGSVSVKELARNKELHFRLERLCKTLRMVTA
jgi:hypothetical protein